MNRALLTAVLLILSFFLTAGDIPQLDKMTSLLDSVKTMSGAYTREIKAGTMTIKSKVKFFEDKSLQMKHLIVTDPKDVRTDIYLRNDSVLVVDNQSKSIYYINLSKSDELLSKMFSLNVFDPLVTLAKICETMKSEGKKDNKGRMVYKFQPDSISQLYSMILVRFDKKGNPDLMEMYDANNAIIMQTNLKSYTDGLPRSISTATVMNKTVIKEIITINTLRINTPIDSTSFQIKNKTYKLVDMEEYIKNNMQN